MSEPDPSPNPAVAIIGAGPAGLMAAERLSAAGVRVTVYDRMPSAGRKFLLAGRGGLNLTHGEAIEPFLARYGAATERLRPIVEAFPPERVREWAEGLGEPTFVGSSSRIFPKSMKASPLLRAWLRRLADQGVAFAMRHTWRGFDAAGVNRFAAPDGTIETVAADATLLALGGASWPRLGSTGDWVPILEAEGVPIAPLRPANIGFDIGWSASFRERFAGTPLKSVAFDFGGRSLRGEAMVTAYGIEGGAIYALSAALRDAIARDGSATLTVDLCPMLTKDEAARRIARQPKSQSLSNRLRRALHLAPVAINLLRESANAARTDDAAALAARIKALPLVLTGAEGIERAISTAGGIEWQALDERLMLRALPGVFAAGEMIDWEAPTGGYLLQASFSTGVVAAQGILDYCRETATGEERRSI